jgi:hypothetical protein
MFMERPVIGADKPGDLPTALISEVEHDTRCGGYGGWWTNVLDGGAVGWAVNPEDEYDGVGYAICRCMTISDGTKHD